MLSRLWKAIDKFLKPALVEESDDASISETSTSSADSAASLVLSIEDDSVTGTAEESTPVYQIASLQEINGVISKLYRLSAIIRKPKSLRGNARVASYIEKVEDGPDQSEYEAHVRQCGSSSTARECSSAMPASALAPRCSRRSMFAQARSCITRRVLFRRVRSKSCSMPWGGLGP